MSTIDDGYIKYDRSFFTKTDPLPEEEFIDIEKWRTKLFMYKLIGEYLPEKIGYGNMSQRRNYQSIKHSNQVQFCITATQTGRLKNLDGRYYTRILDYDLIHNQVTAHGPLEASSESLTHAAIYESDPRINAVIHIHNKDVWLGMIRAKKATTAPNIPYGTIDMANAVKSLIAGKAFGTFAMEGHEEGVVIFAEDMDKAGDLTLQLYNDFK
jgi:ribulose-5-phosphate 4-epimerase/fuculose-1-phosphate aldolase